MSASLNILADDPELQADAETLKAFLQPDYPILDPEALRKALVCFIHICKRLKSPPFDMEALVYYAQVLSSLPPELHRKRKRKRGSGAMNGAPTRESSRGSHLCSSARIYVDLL